MNMPLILAICYLTSLLVCGAHCAYTVFALSRAYWRHTRVPLLAQVSLFHPEGDRRKKPVTRKTVGAAVLFSLLPLANSALVIVALLELMSRLPKLLVNSILAKRGTDLDRWLSLPVHLGFPKSR